MKLHQLLSLQILLCMFLCEIQAISYDASSATFNDINVVLTSSQFNNPSECPKILLSVKVSFQFHISHCKQGPKWLPYSNESSNAAWPHLNHQKLGDNFNFRPTFCFGWDMYLCTNLI